MQESNDPQASIAIVGVAVLFPGGDGLRDLWNTLRDGLNTVSEVGEPVFLRPLHKLKRELS